MHERQHTTMPNPINSAALGSLVREAREVAGLTQTHHAVGLALHIGPGTDASAQQPSSKKQPALSDPVSTTSLGSVLARATLTHVPRSSILGWPTTKAGQGKAATTVARRKPKA